MPRFHRYLAAAPLLLLSLALTGCASSNQATESAEVALGVWNVVVEGTADGDLTGVLIVTQVAEELTGEAIFPDLGPPAPFEEFGYDGETFSFSATLEIDGQPTLIVGSAEIDGDQLEGTFEVPGTGSFEMTGTRTEE